MPSIDLSDLPPRLHRKGASTEIEKKTGIKLSPRTIEAWGLPATIIAGRAYHPTLAIFERVEQKIAAAERATAA